MIKTISYPVNNNTLSAELLSSLINTFWNNVFSKLDHKNNYLMLLIKANYDNKDMDFRVLANLRRVAYEDKELFANYICDNLALLTDSYTSTEAKNIIFSYIVKKGQLDTPLGEKSFLEAEGERCF